MHVASVPTQWNPHTQINWHAHMTSLLAVMQHSQGKQVLLYYEQANASLRCILAISLDSGQTQRILPWSQHAHGDVVFFFEGVSMPKSARLRPPHVLHGPHGQS